MQLQSAKLNGAYSFRQSWAYSFRQSGAYSFRQAVSLGHMASGSQTELWGIQLQAVIQSSGAYSFRQSEFRGIQLQAVRQLWGMQLQAVRQSTGPYSFKHLSKSVFFVAAV